MEIAEFGGQEVAGVARVEGPIVVVEGIGNVGYDEVAEVVDSQGRLPGGRRGDRRCRGLRRHYRPLH